MLTIYALVCLSFICFFVIDDLIMDVLALLKGLKPVELKPEQISEMRKEKEKRIAIIVANWHEAEVIGRMVAGNLKRIDYNEFQFFLGVYANDSETSSSVQNLEASYPHQVHVVINSLPGPTSKGQMLNEIVRRVMEVEKEIGQNFDLILMHDSEDILHPLSLKLINHKMQNLDFLQIPVFSFNRPLKEWVGSTYVDEFAELHTKDLLIREYLGASLPSAGVGTALSRRLVQNLMKKNNGSFLNQESLTEDYFLGMSSHDENFQSGFCCYYVKDAEGKKDFIATREFFPNKFKASVRQKARWVVGIVFQGTQMLPFRGKLAQLYFLYRDRRGPLNHLVAMMTTALTIYCFFYWWFNGQYPEFMNTDWFRYGSVIATVGMLSRFIHRTYAVWMVNSWVMALSVLPRWPVGNFINFWASVKAMRDFFRSKITKQPLRWVKTVHELPTGFGDE